MAQEILPLKNKSENIILNNFPQKENFNCIDIIKFLCAILVCAIHINPFTSDLFGVNLSFWLKQYVCRIAVPFYFVCAGFFLFRKMDIESPNTRLIKSYCFKIARLLGIWTIILFAGASSQLWYLNGLFVAVLILSLLFYLKIKFGYICLIVFLLYVIGLFGDSYYGFVEPLKGYTITNYVISHYDSIFSTTRNGLFFGVPFVFMGAIFAKKRIEINNIVALFGFVVSIILLFFEVYLLSHFSSPKDYNMYLCLLPTVFFLFYFCTHIKLKNRKIYVKLRIYGILIYFLHLLVGYFVNAISVVLKNNFKINLSSFKFLFTLLISLFVAILIERLSRTKTFRWLKYLYS